MGNRISLFKKYSLWFSYILTVLFVFLFIYYIGTHKDQFRGLTNIPPVYFLVIALLVLLFKVVTGLRFKIMMDFFGVRLKLKEWFGLTSVSTMVNYVLPAKAGLLTQALYLKNIHKFNYSAFVTYLGSLMIFTLSVNSFSGLVFLAFYYVMKGDFFLLLFIIFFTGLVLSLAIIFLLPHLSRLKIKWQLLNKIIEGFKFLKSRREVLLRLLCVQIADISIMGLRIFFCYKAIGVDIDIAPALMVGLFASNSGLLNITPANIGIRELFITISSVMIGKGIANGLMASLVDRAVGAIVAFAVGLVFTPIIMGKKNLIKGD